MYSVQALLTHKDRTITVEYVNSKIIMELYEANIRRFMRKLEATALFRLKRSGELAERGLSQKDIQLPLFPVTDALSTRTLVDEWIFQEEEVKISLGVAELAQCARQLKYYKLSYERLITENPARFVELHFPRMLFCAAIREIAKASPHWSIYRRIERELND